MEEQIVPVPYEEWSVCPQCGGRCKSHTPKNRCGSFFCVTKVENSYWYDGFNHYFKINEFIHILLSPKKKQIIFYDNPKLSKAYSVDSPDFCLSLYDHSNTEVLTTKNWVPAVVGGALFGVLGMMAGSMMSDEKASTIEEQSYLLELKTTDIDFPGFIVYSKDLEMLHRLFQEISILRGEMPQPSKPETSTTTPAIEQAHETTIIETPDEDSSDDGSARETPIEEQMPTAEQIEQYRQDREKAKRLGFESYEEYFDYLEYMKAKRGR